MPPPWHFPAGGRRDACCCQDRSGKYGACASERRIAPRGYSLCVIWTPGGASKRLPWRLCTAHQLQTVAGMAQEDAAGVARVRCAAGQKVTYPSRNPAGQPVATLNAPPGWHRQAGAGGRPSVGRFGGPARDRAQTRTFPGKMAPAVGFEPTTNGLTVRCATAAPRRISREAGL